LHEIRRGGVLSIKWVFENQPFVPAKADPPDPDKARRIADGDVEYIAWRFKTQRVDAPCAHAPGSAGTVDKALALVRGCVCTVTWMFEMQPLDSTNKKYHNEEETSAETCI